MGGLRPSYERDPRSIPVLEREGLTAIVRVRELRRVVGAGCKEEDEEDA